MNQPFFALWVYLAKTPLLWLTVTLAVYLAADYASRRTGRHPLMNPVLHAIWILGALLALTGTPYQEYFAGAQFVHFLLGPATVVLAIPLYEHRRTVMKALLPMSAALLAGSLAAFLSAVAVARLLGVPHEVLVSLAPKSVTAAVAMAISQSLGGDPALTAVLVILTGIIGAVAVTPLMNALRITDWRARGFAAGIASHGLGTARAFQVHPVAGTFAGIAMGLNAFLTAILVPLLIGWAVG